MAAKNRIRELRKSYNLSQENFSVIFGTTQQAVSRMENGLYGIPTDLLILMSDFFNVTTDYILGISDVKRYADRQKRMNQEVEKYYDIVLRYQNLTDTNRRTLRLILERLEQAQREEESERQEEGR